MGGRETHKYLLVYTYSLKKEEERQKNLKTTKTLNKTHTTLRLRSFMPFAEGKLLHYAVVG